MSDTPRQYLMGWRRKKNARRKGVGWRVGAGCHVIKGNGDGEVG